MVKIWYQAGSAWYGHFPDVTRRVLCPELLLYDEDLVRVDPATQDNYVRYDQGDGTRGYAWMSFHHAMVNFADFPPAVARVDLINDAPTTQSAVLNQDEFKQFFVTLGLPEDAREGVYHGAIELLADGQTVGAVPVRVRVLPFTLPRPRTNYNLDKEFYGSLYWSPDDCSTPAQTNPQLLQNLRRHNILHPMLERARFLSDEAFERQIRALQANGLSTRPLFGLGPNAARALRGEKPTPPEQAELDAHRAEVRRVLQLTQKLLGHSDVYSYAWDEAGPDTIRQEQAIWKITRRGRRSW